MHELKWRSSNGYGKDQVFNVLTHIIFPAIDCTRSLVQIDEHVHVEELEDEKKLHISESALLYSYVSCTFSSVAVFLLLSNDEEFCFRN